MRTIIIMNLTLCISSTRTTTPNFMDQWRNTATRVVMAILLMAGAEFACAQEAVTLIIKNHRFEPNVIRVNAGQRVKLQIENQDDSAEEFESYSLRVEKIIPAKGKVQLSIGPLKPGKYVFFGEFNQATANGQIIAE